MAQARKETYQNLSSVTSIYGTGTDGYLGIGMSPTQYCIRSGVAFTVPADPGPYDLTIPANAGSTIKAWREAMHQDAHHEYKIYIAVNAVIKNQLKKSMPRDTIREIEDEIGGLNAVPIIDIMDHCMGRLGKINDTLVEENRVQ